MECDDQYQPVCAIFYHLQKSISTDDSLCINVWPECSYTPSIIQTILVTESASNTMTFHNWGVVNGFSHMKLTFLPYVETPFILGMALVMVSAIALLVLPAVLSEPIILPENRAECKFNLMYITSSTCAVGYVFVKRRKVQVENTKCIIIHVD